MEKFDIKANERTPKVLLDPDELAFHFSGSSLPENAQKFYQPILDWLDVFIREIPKTSTPLDVTVMLDYYNSSSLRYVTEVFKKIRLIHEKGFKVIIDWYYDEEDDLLRESGEELSEITGLPFNFCER